MDFWKILSNISEYVSGGFSAMLFDTEVQHCSYSVEKNILKNQEYFFFKTCIFISSCPNCWIRRGSNFGWMDGGRMDGGVYEWIDR